MFEKVNGVFYFAFGIIPPPPRGRFLAVNYHNKSGKKASSLIPVIPLTTIIKYTQLLYVYCRMSDQQEIPDQHKSQYLY